MPHMALLGDTKMVCILPNAPQLFGRFQKEKVAHLLAEHSQDLEELGLALP
jgi:hypothetical protein